MRMILVSSGTFGDSCVSCSTLFGALSWDEAGLALIIPPRIH